MLKRNLIKTTWCKLRKQYAHKNLYATHANGGSVDLQEIRVFGILAHIDAGKTTTTERMLFYSGLIKHMGEVHQGNTVTDYMEQERQRGITITSAAVTFNWKNFCFNLIDTPGHIDFTMGVEQTLKVLDGVVVVLDGSAGVEAQTITVCKQADRYNLPRIFYVNKMDKADANFDMSLRSIESKLHICPLPVQIPFRESGCLKGIIDVISLQKIIFDTRGQGVSFTRTNLIECEDAKLWAIATEKRRLLTDKLSELDDTLAEIIIQQESLEKIPAQALTDSLRRITLSGKGVPVLLGSSYKNMGVQPLMDSVILYLPSPTESKHAVRYECFGNNLSARVFKIVHDKQRGPISFIRVYTGSMKKGQKLFNVRERKAESTARLYAPCADEYKDISAVEQGSIAAVTGLESSIVGDLLTSNASVHVQAEQAMNKVDTDVDDVKTFFTAGATVPNPVFFCTIEPPSLAAQRSLDTALVELQREDPSFRVTNDMETGQTILGGMGELHIDIIKERIRTEYKIDADLGPLQIAYKETIQQELRDTMTSEHMIGTVKHNVSVTLSVIPNHTSNNVLILDRSPECIANVDTIQLKVMQAVKKGVKVALTNGPKVGCPVINVGVKLHFLEAGRTTSVSYVSSVVTKCIKKLLQNAGATLLEPIMDLEVVVPDEHSSNVLADLSKRRAEILHIDVRGGNKIFTTLTPLSELLGYATNLRIITSGTGTFSLELSHYHDMAPTIEREAMRKVTGV